VWSEALADATWDEESFSSVAGLMLNRQSSESQFAIGDAAAMIPPLTGNGMSMAFESAEVAFEPLLRFSRRQVSWEECLRIQATAWDLHFSARLRWAAFVQSLLFNTAGQQFLLICTRLFPRLPVFFFSRTR
jgi:flavin-dependent dehydrogenase